MKNQKKMRLPFAVASMAVSLSCVVGISRAEGSKNFQGAQGVNRVVRSEAGYNPTAHGTAALSFHNVPIGGGSFNDKPSFYVGGTIGRDEIDAGLQYEPLTVGRYKPGWAAFISVSKDGARARFFNPILTRKSDGVKIAWRGGPVPAASKLLSGSIKSSVSYTILSDGQVSATIGAVKDGGREEVVETTGQFRHPLKVAGNMNGTTKKRVTAMTRSYGDAANDGSRISCTWFSSNFYLNGIDHDRTGYDSPQNNWPGAKDGEGNYKVNFPGLSVSPEEARTDSPASRSATVLDASGIPGGIYSRYTSEKVDINLRYEKPRGFGIGLRGF